MYRSDWQAYEDHTLTYKMLVIESMDSDTEKRRLSPVAVLGDGYLDLINGPQDHGWCSGYTCRKRLSTFPAIVATGNVLSTCVCLSSNSRNQLEAITVLWMAFCPVHSKKRNLCLPYVKHVLNVRNNMYIKRMD